MNAYVYTGAEKNEGNIEHAREVRTETGLLVAKDFTRIIHGNHGAFIEIHNDDIVKENIHIPKNQAYRPTFAEASYNEWRTNDSLNLMLYFERKRADEIADYRIGYWYISPEHILNFDIIAKIR